MTMKMRTLMVIMMLILAHTAHTQPAAEQTPAKTSARDQYLKGIGNNLDQVESLLIKIRKSKADGGGPMQCPAPSSLKDMYVGGEATVSPELQKLDLYNSLSAQCRAFAASDPAMCNSLAFRPGIMSAEKTTTLSKECYANYVEMKWIHGLVTDDPSTVKYCQEYMLNPAEPSHPMLPPSSSAGACQEISSGFAHPESVCARLSARYSTIPHCTEALRSFRGNKDVCRVKKEPVHQARCLAFASFFNAHKTKNSAACGGSPLCRVMAGERGACETYARQANALYCELWSSRRLTELLSSLERMVEGFEPKSLPAFQARRERYNKLRREMKELGVTMIK